MLFQPGNMGEDIGPARDDMRDSENPLWKALTSLGSGEVIERGDRFGGLWGQLSIKLLQKIIQAHEGH